MSRYRSDLSRRLTAALLTNSKEARNGDRRKSD
jgi:hypothetical protein